MRYRGLLFLILGLVLSEGAALADVLCQLRPGETEGEQLGYSVAASGTTTAFGANMDNVTRGSVLASGQANRVLANDGAPGDQFGFAIALDGKTLVVGAPTADTPQGNDAGAVYIFTKEESGRWKEVPITLTPDAGSAGAQFGFTVALHGSTLAVGAAMDADGGTLAGAVYVFERTSGGWVRQAKFPGAHPFDGLGSAIALGHDVLLDKDVLVAGAPFVDGPAGGNQGAVYLYTKDVTWMGTQPQVLMAPEAKAGDQFGYAVSIEGSKLAVGARRGDVGVAVDAGWVDMFQRREGAWVRSVRLTAGEAQAGALFGNAVALSKNRVLVGAFMAVDGRGAAYLFDNSGFNVNIKVGPAPNTLGKNDRFGFAVAMSDETIVIGSFMANNSAGSVCEIVPEPRLSIADVKQKEGNSGNTDFTFTVTLSSPAGPGGVTFDVATTPGTADRLDYVSTVLSARIPEGSSRFTFKVQVKGDIDPETDETFLVKITPAGGGEVVEAVGTILNDDLNLTIDDASLTEGDSGNTVAVFTVLLSSPAVEDGVTFDIATAPGTAEAGADYGGKSLKKQKISAGSTSYTFTVPVKGDTVPEPDETFLVNLANVTGATVTDGQGQGTIRDDDRIPSLTIDDVSLAEGSGGVTTFRFTLRLSSPAPPGGVSFDVATAPGTAGGVSDYETKSLTGQTIPAGGLSYELDVLAKGDFAKESDETFFVNVANVTGATLEDGQGLGTINNDDQAIHDAQGSGPSTPIPGNQVSVQGIVTGDFQESNELSGFFLQEGNTDVIPMTSKGIFVFCGTCSTSVKEGWQVGVIGIVSESSGMTQITASAVVVIDEVNQLAAVPVTMIDLPVVGDVDAFYEAREEMLVRFADPLTVSGSSDLARFGQIELFEGGRPRQFTESSSPDAAGYAAHLANLARRRVILDDDNNTEYAPLAQPEKNQSVFYPRPYGFSIGTQGLDFFRDGDRIDGLTGVLHWSSAGVAGTEAWRIRPLSSLPAVFTVDNPRPESPPAVGGAIQVASVNLANYFTTIDTGSNGPCGPAADQECRGADSAAELARQRERASIVICRLNAEVVVLTELENTTATGTIADLLGSVNTRCGNNTPYAFVGTGILGTDAVRVAMIFRSPTLAQDGSPLKDSDPIHDRPPVAQKFIVKATQNPAVGERFTVVGAHFKSRDCDAGATGPEADSGDGQGCYAGRRTAQAERLLAWLGTVVGPAVQDPDVLILGDLGSYARETPVTLIGGAGNSGLQDYSVVSEGQLGNLAHVFSSLNLAPRITGTRVWHINADEAELFDYNDEIRDEGEAASEEKPDGSSLSPPRTLFLPGSPYRASSHDPMLVGLFPSLSGTKSDSGPRFEGGTVTYTVVLNNASSRKQRDNLGNEFFDVLPGGLTLFSAVATTGTITTDTVGNSVAWNGALAAQSSVTISITATINPGIAGTVISNQATILYDADGNGTNDSVALTDDPDQEGDADPTTFTVEQAPPSIL